VSQASRALAYAFETGVLAERRSFFLRAEDLPLKDIVAEQSFRPEFLRLQHKDASLEELGKMAEPPLTKDAVAGRIRRLLATADKHAEDMGIPDTEASLSPEMLDL
jgi:hypothetical protein